MFPILLCAMLDERILHIATDYCTEIVHMVTEMEVHCIAVDHMMTVHTEAHHRMAAVVDRTNSAEEEEEGMTGTQVVEMRQVWEAAEVDCNPTEDREKSILDIATVVMAQNMLARFDLRMTE